MRTGNLGIYQGSYKTTIQDLENHSTIPKQTGVTVYAQYRYIVENLEEKKRETLPLVEIYALNRRIENLRSIDRNTSGEVKISKSSGMGTQELIEIYASELHQVLVASPENFGTLPGAVTAGLSLNIRA